MMMVFPMWVIVYLFRDRISGILGNLPLPIAFIGAGVIFGLMTETFAIIDNLSVPHTQRILIDAEPALDLIYGFFYYLMMVTTWYFVLLYHRFSMVEIFLISGLFGIFTEETGAVFLQIFHAPLYGIFYAIIVMFIYGIFPMLALMVTEGRFENKGTHRLLWLEGLFLQWAIYDLFILPFLKQIFGTP